MKPSERLELLKPLERTTGKPFLSQEECIAWANQAAPLLNFNRQMHVAFLEHASIINIPSLSAETYAASVNHMTGIVQQAIVELRHDLTPAAISPVKAAPAPTPRHSEWKRVSAVAAILLFLFALVGALANWDSAVATMLKVWARFSPK